MARSIASFNGTVMPPDVDYSHGNIKDAPNGTIADVTSNGDMQQFFQELMFRGGITPNELPDNDTNSYQLVDALANYITSIWGTLSNEPSYVSTFAADPTNPIKYGLISSNQVAFTGKLHDTSPSVSSADTKILLCQLQILTKRQLFM
jgi:hypothetical protein